MPEHFQKEFIEQTQSGDVLYLVQLKDRVAGEQDEDFEKTYGVNLIRGMVVQNVITTTPETATEATTTMKVKMSVDPVQYMLDQINLAVETSMFVSEAYSSCQLIVRVPQLHAKRIMKLKALIEIAQSSSTSRLLPKWAEQILLGQQGDAEAFSLEPFVVLEDDRNFSQLLPLLKKKDGADKFLIVAKTEHGLVKLARRLPFNQNRVVVEGCTPSEQTSKFSQSSHLEKLLERKKQLLEKVSSLAT